MEGIKEIMKTSNMNISKDDAMQIPLVSICSITYNHAPYIRQCLDGFLMQKTNFKYEIIIHDDASTDGTAEIIKEYAEKYPDLIIPILQTENQYSKGLRGFYVRFVFPRAKGRYIALCEGDDYWTDPLKLQKQVDFLEANPDFVMSTHGYNEYWEAHNEISNIAQVSSKEITLSTLIYCSWYFFQPLSLLFRSAAFNIGEYNKYACSRDTILFYYLLTKGQGFYFQEKMGIYRRHSNGIWTGSNRLQQWMSDYRVRMSIYEKEQSSDAVVFLVNLFYENIGRYWLIKNFKIIVYIYKAIKKHYGYVFALKCIIGRFIGLKNPHDETIKTIEAFHLD